MASDKPVRQSSSMTNDPKEYSEVQDSKKQVASTRVYQQESTKVS
jgi:hypothetical protein